MVRDELRGVLTGLGGGVSMTQLPGAPKIRGPGCRSIEESARIANPGTGTKGQEPVPDDFHPHILNSRSK